MTYPATTPGLPENRDPATSGAGDVNPGTTHANDHNTHAQNTNAMGADMVSAKGGYANLATRIAIIDEKLNPRKNGANPAASAATNAAAIQASINEFPTGGGTLLIDDDYQFSTSLIWDNKRAVKLVGLGGLSGGANVRSRLMYTGVGTGFSFRSTAGVVIEDLWLAYNNTAHAGALIDFGWAGTPGDSGFIRIARCNIGFGAGGASFGTGVCLSLDRAIIAHIEGCNFNSGNVAIRGGFSGDGTVGNPGPYSNGVTIDGQCTFLNFQQVPILNPMESWVITGNVFEHLLGGNAGALGYSSGALFKGRGIQFTGNWCGDANLGTTGTWVDFVGDGLDASANRFGGNSGATAVWLGGIGTKNAENCVVQANSFDLFLNGIVIGGNGAPGLVPFPNRYLNVTNKLVNGGPSGWLGVPSASTITLDPNHRTFSLDGTTTVNTINGGWPDREINLYVTSGLTISEAGNVFMGPGGLTLTADTMITFVSNGGVWIEKSRTDH